MYDFGNDAADGYVPKTYKYVPTEGKLLDYDPDHRPSDSAMCIESTPNGALWVLKVRGLGAIVFRALDSHTFAGVSTFTDDMIQFEDGLDKDFERKRAEHGVSERTVDAADRDVEEQQRPDDSE